MLETRLDVKAIHYDAAVIVVCLGLALFLLCARPAQAANVAHGSCPILTATPWVIASTNISGNQYVITVANEDCAQVSSWVKKIVSQHMSGPPDKDQLLSGGPPGYTCKASPDGRGHPYQGKCEKNGDKNTGFIWVMH